MGRRRLPTEQKRTAGTLRPGRTNPAEPVYSAAAPPMPDWLSEPARAEWERIVPILAAKRVLAETDLGVMAAYCAAVGDQQLANEELLNSPRYYKSGGVGEKQLGGLWKEHPAAKASRELGQQIRLLASELGLTPSSRSKVSSLPETPNADAMAAPPQRPRRQSRRGPQETERPPTRGPGVPKANVN